MIRLSGPILLLALAACATGPSNPSLDSQKVATVTTTRIAYDLRFDPAGTLSERQVRALTEYLAMLRIGHGDHISIDDPVSYHSAERRAVVAAVAAKFGMVVEDSGPIAPATLPPGITRVVITRTRADVRGCPDWSRLSNPETEFSTMSNYGCAVQGNLAAMTADPGDLLAPEAYPGADGDTITKAIATFRAAQPTGGGGTTVKSMSPGGGSQ